MARTSNPRQLTVQADITDVEAKALALNDLSAGALQVIEAYGLKSANPDVLITEIKGWQQTAVDSLFQIGARLQLLNAVVPHGDWLNRLEALGMSPRTAQRIVQATVKYVGDGKVRSEKMLGLGKSKLLELMILDDDEIDVLDRGGEARELDLDEVSRMSVTELRSALRESRLNLEAKDTLIESKDKKINDLDVKLKQAKKFKPSPDSEAQTLQEQAWLDEVSEAVKAVEVHFARLAVVTSDVVSNCTNDSVSKRVADGLRYVHARIDEIAKAHGFEQLDGDYTPEWMRDGKKA